MNFLDFYFIKNKTALFDFYYIDMENEDSYSPEIEIVKKKINNINWQQNANIVLILHHYKKKEEIKIIFDLSKNILLSFNNYEDIWWKLSEIKTSNKILDNYDQTIHNYIVNLLTNDDWENNYQNLKQYFSKKENDLMQIETKIKKETEDVS